MMDIWAWSSQILIFTSLQINVVGAESHHLTDVFHTYERVYYDTDSVNKQHTIARRSAENDVTFTIHSRYRKFNIVLKRDSGIFSEDVQIEVGPETYNIDTGRTYTGKLKGERAKVFGLITRGGHFHGQIQTHNDTFYVEPSHHYFTAIQPFHSILYRLADVNYDFERAKCVADDLLQKLKQRTKDLGIVQLRNKGGGVDTTHEDNKYTFSAQQVHTRRKRAVTIDPSKIVCELYVQADHLFYQKYGGNEDTIIEQLSSYVQAVNNIFQPIDFNKDSSADNIHFIVKRLKIFTDPSAVGYKFPDRYSVEKYLDIHSETNYDDFCLSYMFTDRDFDGGVLGLAWVASLSSSGGVCEKFKTYSGGEQKSLNTGIVTVKNYGKTVASVVTQVTFAHELGHNFGSEHDNDGSSCAPGGTQGNYIMYAKATSGYLPNNDEFSSCSIDQIGPIIASKGRSLTGCFIAQKANICGNKIVETGEECDCGWDDECDETCCYPQASGAVNPCTFKGTSPNYCSPSQGPCCGANCQFKSGAENYVCRQNTTCTDKAICDGSGFSCPESTPKANGTSCNDGQVCYLGECSGSVCLANGYQSCQCAGSSITSSTLCDLCCEDNNGDCKPASEFGITEKKAFPGSPCFNFQGYCDVFYVCREVDPSGPLNNIRKLLLSGEAIETVKTFLTEHWYVGVAAAVGLIIIIAIIVKFCSKSHGPKSKSKQAEKLRSNRVAPHETHM